MANLETALPGSGMTLKHPALTHLDVVATLRYTTVRCSSLIMCGPQVLCNRMESYE